MTLFWIFIVLWAINIVLSNLAGWIRLEWIQMVKWLREQQKVLLANPDFLSEANQTTEIESEITAWIDSSVKFGGLLLISVQTLILTVLLMILFFGQSYIPMWMPACWQAGVFVYATIMFKQYYKAKGMCRGVAVNIDALRFYNEQTESDNVASEPSSADSRGDERDSKFRRRKDDGPQS